LRDGLTISATYLGRGTIIPQEDMQDHSIVARVEVMPMTCPAGSKAVDFNIATATHTIVKRNDSLVKIWAGLAIPATWRVDRQRPAIQGTESRGTPAWVIPQAADQFFRYAAGQYIRGLGHDLWQREREHDGILLSPGAYILFAM
jgi:hypothetical protein